MDKLGEVTAGQRMKHMWCSPQEDKMSLQRTNDIEALFKRLGFLKITNKASEGIYKQSNEEMSVAPIPANENIQTVMSKSMIPDLG